MAADPYDHIRTVFAYSIPIDEWRVIKLLEDADLDTAEGRDDALAVVRPVIEAVPADRLENGEPLRDYLLFCVALSVRVDEQTLREWWGWPPQAGR